MLETLYISVKSLPLISFWSAELERLCSSDQGVPSHGREGKAAAHRAVPEVSWGPEAEGLPRARRACLLGPFDGGTTSQHQKGLLS